MAGITKGVSSKRRSDIFLRKGLDTIPVDLPVGQITPYARLAYAVNHTAVVGGVRFGAHNGLKSDIAPCPKSTRSGSPELWARFFHTFKKGDENLL
jgi:hypothetical protein